MIVLLVMAGAGAGAVLRWLTDRAVGRRSDSIFPWGTFTVNVVGSLILGIVAGAGARGGADAYWYALLATGFCGGLTTFSTFSYETFRLMADGSGAMAARNVAASLAAGLLAAFAGWYLAAAVWSPAPV